MEDNKFELKGFRVWIICVVFFYMNFSLEQLWGHIKTL